MIGQNGRRNRSGRCDRADPHGEPARAHRLEPAVDCGLQSGVAPFEPFILPLESRIQLLEQDRLLGILPLEPLILHLESGTQMLERSRMSGTLRI